MSFPGLIFVYRSFVPKHGTWLFSLEEMHESGWDITEVPDHLTAHADNQFDWERIEPYLARLPLRDRDFIDLYYGYKLKQDRISPIFGVRQMTVSAALARAIERLHFLITMPILDKNQFHRDLTGFLRLRTRTILWGYYITTNTASLGRIFNKSQNKTYYEIKQSIQKLYYSENPVHQRYGVILRHFMRNPRILWYLEIKSWGLPENWILNGIIDARTGLPRQYKISDFYPDRILAYRSQYTAQHLDARSEYRRKWRNDPKHLEERKRIAKIKRREWLQSPKGLVYARRTKENHKKKLLV